MIIILIANGLHYAIGRRCIVVCCYRRDVIVQAGLVCVEWAVYIESTYSDTMLLHLVLT